MLAGAVLPFPARCSVLIAAADVRGGLQQEARGQHADPGRHPRRDVSVCVVCPGRGCVCARGGVTTCAAQRQDTVRRGRRREYRGEQGRRVHQKGCVGRVTTPAQGHPGAHLLLPTHPGPPAAARTDAAAAAERKAAAEAAAASKEEEETKAAAATAAKPMSAAQKAKAEGKVRCRAYGCNEWFKEDENHDGACTHHVAPPLFHEGRKAWSCCPDNKAYDWDGFMAIRGCATSKHTTVAPEQLFAASPTVAMAERANEGAGMKSAADFEAENPEPTAAKAAAKPRPKPRDDGKARCVNGGCQQLYVVADNTDTACKYHKGQAVFHDRGKHWSCCPDKKAWTWEDFMAVEPCTTGPHRDWIPPEEC